MEIITAAYGWEGSEWDHYYPDDLPLAWRLDYYANELFAVVVPFAAWAQASDEVLLEWQGQVSDDFRFFWELPSAEYGAARRLQALRHSTVLVDHWGGIVTPGGGSSSPQAPFSDNTLTQLYLSEDMGPREMREWLLRGMAMPGDCLLLIVAAGAASSLRVARDLAQILGGG